MLRLIDCVAYIKSLLSKVYGLTFKKIIKTKQLNQKLKKNVGGMIFGDKVLLIKQWMTTLHENYPYALVSMRNYLLRSSGANTGDVVITLDEPLIGP